MKKTYNINLSGLVFTMDDDAYDLLNDYLDTLQHAFRHIPDSHELLSDIEGRAAELLSEREATGSAVVTLADVEAVIARIGQPEDMMEENVKVTTEESSEGHTYSETIASDTIQGEGPIPPPYFNNQTVERKLYRDPQTAMLGGVCAGIAAYLRVDVTWVRLLTVALAFISLSIAAIGYIILWIVVPEARTPLQRMQMHGEAPTIQNIGKSVTDSYKDYSENVNNQTDLRSAPKRFLDSVAHICGVIAKIILIMLFIISIPILLALGIGLLACMFALIVLSTSWGAAHFEQIPGFPMDSSNGDAILGLLLAIGVILVIGIPLLSILWMSVMKSRPITKGWKWSLVVIWIVGFLMAAICGGIITVHEEIPDIRNKEAKVKLTDDAEIDSIEIFYDEYINANADAESAQAIANDAENIADKAVKIADKATQEADKTVGEIRQHKQGIKQYKREMKQDSVK